MKLVNKKIILIIPTILFLTIGCALSNPKYRLYGGVYFTDEGGYEVQKIKDYSFTEISGGFEMIKLDSNPFVGPGFQVYGGLVDQERTTEELWNFLTEKEYQSYQFEEPKDRKIDGYTGRLAEFHGIQDNTNIRGKLFAVMMDQKQQFIMLGYAPEDEWRKFETLYNMTLKTVKFYIPNRVIKFDNPYRRDIDKSEFLKSPFPGATTEVAP